MKLNRTILVGLTIALLGGLVLPSALAAKKPAEKKKEQWVQLFNGKDLTGWMPKFAGYALGENYLDTFGVKDGLLTVSYDKWKKFNGKFGHLFYKKEFKNYRLRVEYRFIGDQVAGGAGWATRNNGLMILGQKPETMRKTQSFPVSIEVQLLGGLGKGKRATGNLCTPGTNVVMDGKLITPHVIKSTAKTYDGDQWVILEVEVLGNRVRHIVEGKTVLEYTDPQLDPRDGDAKALLKAGASKIIHSGTISIQAESHPTQFRKIEIMELKD